MTKYGKSKKRVDRRRVRLGAYDRLASSSLADMREFVDLSERLLKQELDALTSRLDDQISCLPILEREAESDWFADDICRMSDIFPKIQRYSLFTSLLGMIEHHLRGFCHSAKEICEVELSAADLRGHGIAQSLDYLTKVCHFRISRNNKSNYNHLKMFQKMRNAIVHADGRLTGRDLTTIRQYRKRNPHFEVTERNEILLSSGFLYTVILTAEQFCKQLLGELNKRLKSSAAET
jgi:hypothetical protein